MLRLTLFLLFVSLFSSSVLLAQSRRVPARPLPSSTPSAAGISNNPSNAPTVINGQTPAEMYEDANTYAKRKFEEFKTKKVPYSEGLREKTQLEARQLAAKYAAQLQERNLNGEDFYYLGSLHILAENNDGASEAFQKYLTTKDAKPEKAQTARAFVVVTNARRKDFAAAESAFDEYMKNTPILLRERVLVEGELAKQYFAAKNYERAAVHGEAAITAGRPAIKDVSVDQKLLDIFSETGFTLFNIQSETKANAKAVTTLEILREAGVAAQSTPLYVDATEKLLRFLSDTGNKPEALTTLKATQDAIDLNFRDIAVRGRVREYFRTREKQYRLIGEPTPEIEIDKWIGMDAGLTPLASMKGKVVLLDFWAMWCKPCFAAFPELTEWHHAYSGQGLQIIGLTRYYGTAGGFNADDAGEYAFLQKFKRAEGLPYPLAVAKNVNNHNRFGVVGLPTTVLIDKKGVVRYIRTGASMGEEIEAVIRKLLAE